MDWWSTLYSLVVHEAVPAVLLVASLRYHASVRSRTSLFLVVGAAGQIAVALTALIVLLAVPAFQEFDGIVLLNNVQYFGVLVFGLLFAGAFIAVLRDAAQDRLRLVATGSQAVAEVT